MLALSARVNDPVSSSRNAKPPLDAIASELHRDLANVDLLCGRRQTPGVVSIELLLLKFQDLRIKMDGCLNHGRAHIHIDYGRVLHAASYAIDTGELLAGKRTEHDRSIRAWIGKHRAELLEVWTGMRGAGVAECTVANLKGSALP